MAIFFPKIPRIPMPKIPYPTPSPYPNPESGKILSWLLGKLATLIGGSKKQDKNSTVEDINKIQELLETFKSQMHQETSSLETGILKEVNYYIEELNDIFEQKQELFLKYSINVRRIERSLEKLVWRLQGSIDNYAGRKISLDNLECRKILQMIPGSKKQEAMSVFLQSVLQDALEQYCKEFRDGLEEIMEEVDEEILQAVEDAGKYSVRQSEILGEIDSDNYSEKTQKVLLDASELVALSELVDQCLEVR